MNKKNLKAAYTRSAPPHTPIIRNIGISKDQVNPNDGAEKGLDSKEGHLSHKERVVLMSTEKSALCLAMRIAACLEVLVGK